MDKVGAVVVAQLVERLLLILEVRSSNPVIGKNLYWTFVYYQLYWKDEKNKKRPGMVHFFLKKSQSECIISVILELFLQAEIFIRDCIQCKVVLQFQNPRIGVSNFYY